MPNVSSIAQYSASSQKRFLAQRAFVQAHKSSVPSLVSRTAKQCGCSTANVYSVLRGNTFNAQIIEVLYTVTVAHLGVVDASVASAHQSSMEVMEAQNHITRINESWTIRRTAEVAVQDALRSRDNADRVHQINLANLRTFLHFNEGRLSDQLVLELTSLLTQSESPEDLSTMGEVKYQAKRESHIDPSKVDPRDLQAFNMMVASGLVDAGGNLTPTAEEELKQDTEVDPADPDPLAPGPHYNRKGEVIYVLGKD